jgi:asparagine synthetase B (glutamine-hydrolysing)
MDMLRGLINKSLEESMKDKDSVAILFSGGLDSLSILLSCLDIGVTPTLYTFYLDSYESEDIQSSRRVANIFGLKLVEVRIDSSDIQTLITDVHTIIKRFGVYKKTAVQCIHPILYTAPIIQEHYVLTGLGAGDAYGTGRDMIRYKGCRDTFDAVREERLLDMCSGSYIYIKELIESYGKIMITPYKQDNDIMQYLLSLTYVEMHSPKQKYQTYKGYQEIMDKYKLYRREGSFQCVSRIREWHELLLGTYLNTKSYKVVAPIYKNIYMGGFLE